MKKIYRYISRKTGLAAILLVFFFSHEIHLFAQIPDNPYFDQLPAVMRQSQQITEPGTPLQSSVITIDNWDNYSLGIDQAESTVATDPGNPLWFFTAYNINETHHTEDGLNWNKNNPGWTNMAGDPVVAYDSIGNLYYINLYWNPITGAKVVRSATNGQTWETPVLAATGDDKCWIACDQTNGPYANYVYVCMTNNNTGYFARSRDHGLTFENTYNFSTQTLPGMSVCVGPYLNTQGGSVYVVTNSGDPFASLYTFYRSINGGGTFTLMSVQQFSGYVGTMVGSRHSVEGMRTRPYPFIAADNSLGPYRGRLYCVYASNDPPGNGNLPDVWCRYSTNAGTTWSNAKRVNDDPNPQANNQYHPAVWCDKSTGKLYIQWMDTRDTPTHDSAYIYGTYSDDGGVTFKPNQKISNKKMKIDCQTCGGAGSPRYQGDYNGIVSNRKVSMAGWTDFRNGTFLSMTGYFPDFSMALDKTLDSLYAPLDSINVLVSIPGTRLYSDTVLLSGSITPTPSTGNISVSFPNGSRILSIPGSKTAKLKVSGVVPLGYYNVEISAKGPNGTPVHVRDLTLKLKSTQYIWVSANAIPPSICPGSASQLMANAQGGVGTYSYAWLPTTGLSNPSIQNPIASPTVTTMYHVRVNDTGGHTAEDSILVSVIHVPSTPGPIIGPDSVCRDSTVVFSITDVPGATSYSWMVPAGATIMAGQNTSAIEVKWGNNNGNISVIAGNDCGNSNPSVKQITAETLPQMPGQIHGPDTACQGSTTGFYVGQTLGAKKYLWIVPGGSAILSGQYTDSITVNIGAGSGNVSVSAENDCGTSNPQSTALYADPLPGSAGTISGKDTVCLNHAGFTYSITAITGADYYLWELPVGAYITGGDSTNSITVNFGPGAASGIMSVRGVNSCGPGTSSSEEIVVKTCAGIQGSKDIPLLKIYPDPADNILNIQIDGITGNLGIILLNFEGKEVLNRSWKNISGEFVEQFDISAYPKGLYAMRIITGDKISFRKIILK